MKLKHDVHFEWIIVDACVVATLIGLGVGARPAYRAFCEYRTNQNLAAAEAAAGQGNWGTARDQAHSVLMARQNDFNAFRILTRALGKLEAPSSYMAATGLFSDPRSTRDDRLEALQTLAAQAPQALVMSAYGSLPEALRNQAAFRVAITPLLVRRGEIELAETWMRAATRETADPKVRLELLRALCGRPKSAGLAEARRILAGLIADKADAQALASLLLLGDTADGLTADPALPDLPAWLQHLPQATTRHHLLAMDPELAARPGEVESMVAAAIERFLASDPAPLGTWLIRHEQAETAARILKIPAKTLADAYLVRLHALLHLRDASEFAAAAAAPPPGVDLVEFEMLQARFAAQSGDPIAASAAWTRALSRAALDTNRNRFIDVAAAAVKFAAPEAATNAWVAALRLGWGSLPMYRDVLPLFASLSAQGRSEDLLAISQTLLRFEPGNPELLANYYYLALLHGTMSPKQVSTDLKKLPGQLERPECQCTLMLAEMMDGHAAAALVHLPKLRGKGVSAAMKSALEGTARVLAGDTEAGGAVLKNVAWNSLMRQERNTLTDLLGKSKAADVALPELTSPQAATEPELAPAWRKAVDQLAKARADEVLPALPALPAPTALPAASPKAADQPAKDHADEVLPALPAAWRKAVDQLAKDHADEVLPALPAPRVRGAVP